MHNDVSGTIYSESKTEPDNNHEINNNTVLIVGKMVRKTQGIMN